MSPHRMSMSKRLKCSCTQQRSRTMRAIKSCNTKPEILLRSLLHRAGYRFRLHCKHLPAKPDIVFPGRRAVIFVHGCFWHQHSMCRAGHVPASRQEYWVPKLERNKQRDKASMRAIRKLGWRAAVVWECQLSKNPEQVMKRLVTFLSTPKGGLEP